MKSIRFVHTADIHFGVENYGRIDSATGIHTRLLDFEKAFGFCVDHAIKNDVDLFVFSGDAYKTAYPTPTQQKLLLNQFLRLTDAGIPVVIIVGNHDHPLSFGRAHALDVFSAFREKHFYVFSKPQAITIQTKSGPVQVIGVPWPMRHTVATKEAHQMKEAEQITEYLSSQITEIISRLARDLDHTIPTLLAGHLTVTTGVFSGSEKKAIFGTDPLFMPSQLAIDPIDYVALGHLHRFQDLQQGGRCPVVYSGSPERVDFGERKEDKGFCDVTISVSEGVKKTTYSFVKTPVRPMVQVDITIPAMADQTESVLAALAQHDLTNAIVKIRYTLPSDVKDVVDLNAIERACSAAHYIVGITPEYVIPARVKRAQVSSAMTMEELLEKYLAMRQIDSERMVHLQKIAAGIAADVAREQEKGDESYDDE